MLPRGAPSPDQAAFGESMGGFRQRVDSFPENEADRAASTFLDPDERWNPLINAVSTFYSGAELDRISARDLSRYDDTGVNWRIVEGYGTVVAAHGAGLRVRLMCPVQRIDRRGKRLRIETALGSMVADTVIVTLPSNLIAGNESLFLPALQEKTEAAAGLPLGLADKLFLSLAGADEFRDESRTFGRMDRMATAAYHFRPFGRPEIEAYFGGQLAAELESGGEAAFIDFAVAELVELFGSDFAKRVKPIGFHAWAADPFARGSYSYALPGRADDRAILARPVEDRVFFAGEATSLADYSTAHGAYSTGIRAADEVITRRISIT
jgi:monoamine oxidase